MLLAVAVSFISTRSSAALSPLIPVVNSSMPLSSLPSPSGAASIDEMISHVEPAYRDACRRILLGEPLTFGQGYQDWWIVHNIDDLKRRRWGEGWYLDIGTNHATDISNTLFFDKCLGWRGVCVEPNPKYHEEIRRSRSCELVPHCVLGRAKEVVASGSGELMSVVGAATAAEHDSAGEGEVMKCRGIIDVMSGLDTIPPQFDFASIDIEGAEGDVLRCFPFDDVRVNHWLVETNKQPQVAVDWFFHRHGYAAVHTFGDGQNDGYFLDTLYSRRERSEIVPPGGGKLLRVVNGVVSETNGHNYYLWPANGQQVLNSEKGPGNGNDWLDCS